MLEMLIQAGAPMFPTVAPSIGPAAQTAQEQMAYAVQAYFQQHPDLMVISWTNFEVIVAIAGMIGATLEMVIGHIVRKRKAERQAWKNAASTAAGNARPLTKEELQAMQSHEAGYAKGKELAEKMFGGIVSDNPRRKN